MNLAVLRQAVRQGRLEWRKHILQRMAERGLPQATVLEVLNNGELIEDYPNDKPFPSGLLLGYIDQHPLHVVAAVDEAAQRGYIITAYEPSLESFEPDYRTRRKRDSQ